MVPWRAPLCPRQAPRREKGETERECRAGTLRSMDGFLMVDTEGKRPGEHRSFWMEQVEGLLRWGRWAGWGWLGKNWGENPEVRFGRDLSDMSGRPQRRCQVAGRICGSKLIEEVRAPETNLEVISLRIFKSMGTDEITGRNGSEKGEAGLDQTRRTPAIPRDPKPRSQGCAFQAPAYPQPRLGTWLETGPHLSLAAGGPERGNTEPEGGERSGEKPGEENAGRWEGLPGSSPSIQGSEGTAEATRSASKEAAVTTDEGPSGGAGRLGFMLHRGR